jgi:predicted small metal-binding protein
MRTVTCECGHEATGSTEKDAMTKMESHMRNDHPEKSSSEIKKMMKAAEKTVKEGVASM